MRMRKVCKAFERQCLNSISFANALSCCLLGIVLLGFVAITWQIAWTTPSSQTNLDNLANTEFDISSLPIDLIYTWVNDSHQFQQDMRNYIASDDKSSLPLHDRASVNRFRDNDELRYSLRSAYKHAGWVRHIFLVTNGQIPYWLDTQNSRLSIVTHSQIFPNQSHLPTFSSPAIESHLHRIPNLSNHSIYCNDDVAFGAPVWPDDFFSRSFGHAVYLSWQVPHCAQGCPDAWIGDHYCDQTCNVEACDYDDGDCLSSSSSSDSSHWQRSSNTPNSRHCSESCPTHWIGDQVCDRPCNNPACAFDGADCGTEELLNENFYQILLPACMEQPRITANDSSNTSMQKEHILMNLSYELPFDLTALYLNLTLAFPDTIEFASHDNLDLVRSAAVTTSASAKVLTLVLFPEADFTIPHTVFSQACDDVSKTNASAHHAMCDTVHDNSTAFADPHAVEILIVGEKHNVTINLFRARHSPLPAQSASLINDCVANISTMRQLRSVKGSNVHRVSGNRVSAIAKQHSIVLNVLLRDHVGVKPTAAFVWPWPLRHQVYDHSDDCWTDEGNERSRSSNCSQNHALARSSRVVTNAWLRSISDSVLPPSASLKHHRHLLDAYGSSLRTVNKLFTSMFGKENRKAPAHMPHFLDKNVMTELQALFPEAYQRTSSHRFRAGDDIQHAFAYFYFVMNAKSKLNLQKVFERLDANRDNALEEREVRLLAMILANDPALGESEVEEFTKSLANCSGEAKASQSKPSTIAITFQTLADCEPVVDAIRERVETQPRYPHRLMDLDQVEFYMLSHTNRTIVQRRLHELLMKRPKFLCINDGLNKTDDVVDGEVSAVLELVRSFYDTYFPTPSPFELPVGQINPFTTVQELHAFQDRARTVQLVNTIVLFSLCLVLFGYLCWQHLLSTMMTFDER